MPVYYFATLTANLYVYILENLGIRNDTAICATHAKKKFISEVVHIIPSQNKQGGFVLGASVQIIF